MVIAGGRHAHAPARLRLLAASTEPAMVIAGGSNTVRLALAVRVELQRSRRW